MSWKFIPGLYTKRTVSAQDKRHKFYKNLADYYNKIMSDKEKIRKKLSVLGYRV